MKASHKTSARAHVVVGTVGSGKTERLLEHVRGLVEQKTDPDDIVVFCAAPQAVHALRRRMRAEGLSDDIRVCTVRDFALDLLGTDAARAFTHRKPRLMLPYEEDFLMQDLGTSGVKPKRLQEMLKFFWHEIAEMKDPADWLLPGEEESIYELLQSYLDCYGIYHPDELSNRAVRYLLSGEDVLEEARVGHVLVDDYQVLSRSSQILTSLLAGTTLTIAADPHANTEVYEAFPSVLGVDEFIEENPDARVDYLTACRSSQEAGRIAANLLSDEGWHPPVLFHRDAEEEEIERPSEQADRLGRSVEVSKDAPAGSLTITELKRDTDDLDALVARVREALDAGMDPQDVYVTFGSRRWGREIRRALDEANIAYLTPKRYPCLQKDIEDISQSMSERIFALLLLAADQEDAAAWRALCGFAAPLVASADFKELHDVAVERGCTFAPLLEEILADPQGSSLGVSRAFIRRCQEVQACLRRFEGLVGDELVGAIVSVVNGDVTYQPEADLLELIAVQDDDDNAAILSERALRRYRTDGLAADAAGAIRLFEFQDLVGQSPKLLIASGMVNGFTPPRLFFDKMVRLQNEANLMWGSDLQRLYAAMGKCTADLVVLYFIRSTVETADALDLKVDRIRMEDGERVTLISPSEYLKHIRPGEAS